MKRRTTKNKKKYSIKGGSGIGKTGKRRTKRQSRTPSPTPDKQLLDNESGLIAIPTKSPPLKKMYILPHLLPGPISGVSNSNIYDRVTGEPIYNSNINYHTNIMPQFPNTPPRNTPEMIIETPRSQISEGYMSFSEMFNTQGPSQGSRISSNNSSPSLSIISDDVGSNNPNKSKPIKIPNNPDFSIITESLAGNPDSNRFVKGGKNKIKKKIKKTRKRKRKINKK